MNEITDGKSRKDISDNQFVVDKEIENRKKEKDLKEKEIERKNLEQ